MVSIYFKGLNGSTVRKCFPSKLSYVKFLKFNRPLVLNYVGQELRIFTTQFFSVLIEMFKIQRKDKIHLLIFLQSLRAKGTTSKLARKRRMFVCCYVKWRSPSALIFQMKRKGMKKGENN